MNETEMRGEERGGRLFANCTLSTYLNYLTSFLSHPYVGKVG